MPVPAFLLANQAMQKRGEFVQRDIQVISDDELSKPSHRCETTSQWR
jgi:hypothetical protein